MQARRAFPDLTGKMRNLPAIFIAAILVCVAAARDVPRLLEKYKDADHARREWFKRVHPNGAPDFTKLKENKASTPVSYGSGYSGAGFVASSYFLDDQCSDAIFTTGFPVNTCFIEIGFAYMVRLTKDSCVGGVIEYYFDKQCKSYAGSSSLTDTYSTPCADLGGLYAGTVCTTSNQPKVYAESVVMRYYRGSSCGATDSYLAVPANQCSESDDGSEDTMFTCDGGLHFNTYVAGSNCGRSTGSQAYPAMCFAASNGDDDDFDDDDADDDDFFNDDDDGENEKRPPTVRGRTAAVKSALRKAKAQKGAKTNLRAEDANAKQALALVPTDDDVNYGDDGNADDDRVYSYDDHTYSSGFGDDIYGGDDAIGGGWLNPPPSVSTTAFPTTTAEANAPYSATMSCQAAPKKSTVVFTAKQTIDGVGYSDYTANKAAYEKTFKQTIASAITGATEDSVTNLVVTDPSATAAGIAQAPAHFIKRLLSGSSSLALSYTVTVTGTTLSADALMGQLTTAVETGAFTESMQTYAAENGAAGLENARSDSIDTQSEGDNKKSGLSDGAIIGIAVGVGVPVLAAIIFGIVYCCSLACRTNSVPNAAAPAFQAVPPPSAPAQELQMVPQATPTDVFVGHNPAAGATYASVQAQEYNPKAAHAAPAIEVSAV